MAEILDDEETAVETGEMASAEMTPPPMSLDDGAEGTA